ncbi:MAG: hydrogenase maturation nickel metallochaperone HypA [Cyanobacteriota bacterium]
MHEVSLMEEVRHQALKVAAAEGAERITAVRLRVGELAGVDADALRFAFPLVMAGTIAADATLEIEAEPAEAFCRSCQAPFPPGLEHLCPRCGRFGAELRHGRTLRLVSLEVC